MLFLREYNIEVGFSWLEGVTLPNYLARSASVHRLVYRADAACSSPTPTTPAGGYALLQRNSVSAQPLATFTRPGLLCTETMSRSLVL